MYLRNLTDFGIQKRTFLGQLQNPIFGNILIALYKEVSLMFKSKKHVFLYYISVFIYYHGSPNDKCTVIIKPPYRADYLWGRWIINRKKGLWCDIICECEHIETIYDHMNQHESTRTHQDVFPLRMCVAVIQSQQTGGTTWNNMEQPAPRIAFAIIGLATSVLWNQLMLCVVVLTQQLGWSCRFGEDGMG